MAKNHQRMPITIDGVVHVLTSDEPALLLRVVRKTDGRSDAGDERYELIGINSPTSRSFGDNPSGFYRIDVPKGDGSPGTITRATWPDFRRLDERATRYFVDATTADILAAFRRQNYDVQG